jgi:flagellar basal body-associated protein FliL
MASFLLCILQYVIIMVILAAIGGCGAIVGAKLRKNKDAKASAETGEK